MENNNQQSEAIQELPSAPMHPRLHFESDEAMKSYYLQLANIMNVKYTTSSSDQLSLQSLLRKLKQFTNALQLIDTHEWGKGILEIQNASGVYMMQKDIPSKTLLRANQEIGLHLQFLIQLAGSICFLKKLEGTLYYHNQNVLYLLKKLKEEQTQELQEEQA